MIVNLEQKLLVFRDAVDKGERAEVAWRVGSGGSSGGGVAFPFEMLLIAAFFQPNRTIRNRQRQRLCE